MHSPTAVCEDSIFSPPLLPRMLTKPRTVCFCQPVVSTISARDAPLARFIMATTTTFLLAPDSVAPFRARARGALAFFLGRGGVGAFLGPGRALLLGSTFLRGAFTSDIVSPRT